MKLVSAVLLAAVTAGCWTTSKPAPAPAPIANTAPTEPENRPAKLLVAEPTKGEPGPGPAYTPPPPTARPGQPDPAKVYAMTPDHGVVDGSPDAKVTMIVGQDYACPYCNKARATIEELRKRYGNDLRVVVKQLVVHTRQATAPALAICAANKQGKAHRLDPLLWDQGFAQRQYDVPTPLPDGTEQPCWEHVDGCPLILDWARQAKLDVARLKRDMAGACVPELADVQTEWRRFGVQATPSFFINGRFMSGAQPIENFATLIDEELAKANERIKQGTPKARYFQKWVIETGEQAP